MPSSSSQGPWRGGYRKKTGAAKVAKNRKNAAKSRTASRSTRFSSGPQSSSLQSHSPARVTDGSSSRFTLGQQSLPLQDQSLRRRPEGLSSHASIGRIEDSADVDEDYLNEIIMGVDMRMRGTVGCAYYVAQNETLFFMEEVQLGNIEAVEHLKLQISPTIIIISSRADTQVIENVSSDSQPRSEDSTNGGFDLPYVVCQVPQSSFDYEAGRHKLSSLKLGQDQPVAFGIPSDFQAFNEGTPADQDRNCPSAVHHLGGLIQDTSSISVGCAGAVIAYLRDRRSRVFVDTDPAREQYFRISSIELFTLAKTMIISSDTLLSLQIVDSESHPNLHNQGPIGANSGSKESLSAFGLFQHFAQTPQGKYLLRQYFLRPSLNVELLHDRLNSVDILSRPENEPGVKEMVKCLNRVKNARKLLGNLRRGVSGGTGKTGRIAVSTWSGIKSFANGVVGVLNLARELAGSLQLQVLVALANLCADDSLSTIERLIEDVVDFEESDLQHRTCIKPGIDEDLDEQKRFYAGADSLLSEVAKEIASNIPMELDKPFNVVYFPQIGFLIAMPKDARSGGASWEGSESDIWTRMFATEDNIYFKNSQMREMDEQLGDLYGDICDREIELAHNLAQQVLEHEDVVSKISDTCGQLDCLLAFAQGALRYNLVRPDLTLDNVIDITEGRHLLQELTVDSFIPNSTYLAGGSGLADSPEPDSYWESSDDTSQAPSTILMTGPNYSGKSVYLRQVALIVYLAHIGSFVPATSAKIGLTDKILTRLTTRESVSRAQSAFMLDLQQVSRALNNATARSLLVLDEFGKGTSAVDGAALACAVLHHLVDLPASHRPKTLAATHWHEIFEAGYLAPRPNLAFAHMQVHVGPRAAGRDGAGAASVTYLYALTPGRSSESFGTVCAAMSGVDAHIVARAEELVAMLVRGQDIVLACARIDDEDARILEHAEAMARRFVGLSVDRDARGALDRLLGQHVA